MDVFPTAQITQDNNFTIVENQDANIRLEIQNTPSKTYGITGRKLANFFSTVDINYTAYTAIATALINGKKYNAIGNSEIAGGSKNYWL